MNKGIRRWLLAGVASMAMVALAAYGGVKEDQEGCDKGVASSCNSLGIAYDKGVGVEADEAKSVQLFEKACGLGHAKACESAKKARSVQTTH